MNQTVHPVTRFKGPSPTIPGDKSVSHRSLLFGALARGTTEVSNLLESGDVRSTWSCLEKMGIRIERQGEKVLVHGGELRAPTSPLDCGNSGTTMRLLMGILSGHPFACTLVGDESLSGRPMKRIADPLRRMGAEITLTRDAVAPLTLRGRRPLLAIEYALPVASAQLKSAVLLAGLYAEGTTAVTGLLQSRDHTERLLPHFGVDVHTTAERISLKGGQTLRAAPMQVPGDLSSAAFWLAAGALVPGAKLELTNVSLNPSRMGILHALKRMGAKITHVLTTQAPEEIGTVTVEHAKLKGTTITADEVPSLVDEIPMIAVLASQAEGETVVHGAEELRVKETDRLEAVAEGLRRMGVEIELFEDGFRIQGPQKLRAARIDSYLDHRIAMAFSIGALVADGPTEIEGAECVGISYPSFYASLARLCHGA